MLSGEGPSLVRRPLTRVSGARQAGGAWAADEDLAAVDNSAGRLPGFADGSARRRPGRGDTARVQFEHLEHSAAALATGVMQWYRVVPFGMAGLNVRFSDEELEALRERAEREGRSMQQFAHDAVITAVHEHSRLFNQAADHVLAASEELNRRLA